MINILAKQIFVVVCLVFSISSFSQTASTGTGGSNNNSKCPNSNILGAGLIDKLCWDCVFPIKMFGANMGGGSYPEASTSNYFCTCEIAGTGVPNPGFVMGYRAFGRLLEVVRDPHCSPLIGGAQLFEPSTLIGSPRQGKTDSGSQKLYMNVNSWTFPLLYMIEVMLDKNCTGDTSTMNLVGLSSFSPTWSDDELAFHLNPEAAAVANPAAIAAQMADGIMVTASEDTWGNSILRDSWFWTMGAWGSPLPYTGSVAHSSSAPRETALVAARSLALSHRAGQSRLTMGTANVCGGRIFPMMPKTQYKFSQAYPQAQATAPCCNQLGVVTFKWNEWRNMPGFEDYLYVAFRWTDCCVVYF